MDNYNPSIKKVNIEDELKNSYLGYAMSVIVGRALPDVRDGLKPVQRRILFAMHELGNTYNKPYKKSARIVGDVSGKYHPHGDTAVYDALVRLAQDFSLSCPLIDGQGNFGSVDGDPAADRRYTEVRLMPLAEALLKDLDKGTVDFIPNYDGAETLPAVLPAAFPNLLVNGSSGIAVGMATNIPPHNLNETLNASIAILNNPNITIEELLELIPGPDFPTGGVICGITGILSAYRSGKGRILIRSKAQVEDLGNKERIIVNEIPYQVNKARLLESIAELVKNKVIEGISEIRDESDRDGLRVVIELKKGVSGEWMLQKLYSLTSLEQAFSANMVVIENGRPVQSNLIRILNSFISHRKKVTIRRARFELDKVEAKLHILEGQMVAFCCIDDCIDLIKNSESTSDAKFKLMNKQWDFSKSKKDMSKRLNFQEFRLSETQAQAILDIRLNKLTHLEMDKIESEESELLKKQIELLDILHNPEKLRSVITEELESLKKYSPSRRSVIENTYIKTSDELIADENLVITFSQKGYIKTQPSSDYTVQKRGGKGKSAATLRTEDVGACCLVANARDRLMCFSSNGKVYLLNVHQIPRCSRIAKGKPINNLLPLADKEEITTLLVLKNGGNSKYIFLVSSKGIVKKVQLNQLITNRVNGINALKLHENDRVVGAEFSSGNNDILLFTANGKAVRFSEEEVRAMGRTAAGVRGIKLSENDKVVSLCIPRENDSILTFTENGFGKRSPLDFYAKKSRSTKGVISIKINERNGKVIGALNVNKDEEVLFLTNKGNLVRIRVGEISTLSRNTQGVTLVKLEEGDKVVGFQKLLKELS